MNFEKTSGYITIPDKQVVYTRLVGDEDDQEANGVELLESEKKQLEADANEGQKMMWKL